MPATMRWICSSSMCQMLNESLIALEWHKHNKKCDSCLHPGKGQLSFAKSLDDVSAIHNQTKSHQHDIFSRHSLFFPASCNSLPQ